MPKKYLTVAELIEHLKTLPQSAPVGRLGHFGEFNPMERDDFYIRNATLMGGYHNRKKIDTEVLHISPPYIGPEPD